MELPETNEATPLSRGKEYFYRKHGLSEMYSNPVRSVPMLIHIYE